MGGCASTGVTLPIFARHMDETYGDPMAAGRICTGRRQWGRTVVFISPPVVTAKLHTVSG